MNYLLKIKNEKKATALLQVLRSMDFVEVEEHDVFKEWKAIVKEAEKTPSLSLSTAKAASEKWKKR